MNKDKEVEVDLIMEMADLTIMCKTKANLNGGMRIKERESGKMVIPIEVETIPMDEEVILAL